MTRDRAARIRSDASARELGCTTAIAAMIVGGLLAYLVWRVML
jgi:hypothetical protein